LSISYFTGSPPIGTSMTVFTSSGGLWPMAMASRFIGRFLKDCAKGPSLRRP